MTEWLGLSHCGIIIKKNMFENIKKKQEAGAEERTSEEPANIWDALVNEPFAGDSRNASNAREKDIPSEVSYISSIRQRIARIEGVSEDATLDGMILYGPGAFMSLLQAKVGAGRSKELIISMLDEQVKNDYIRRYDLPKDATWEDIRDEDVDAFIDDCEDNGLSLDEGDDNYFLKHPEEYRKVLVKRYELPEDTSLETARGVFMAQNEIMNERINNGSSFGYLEKYIEDRQQSGRGNSGVIRVNNPLLDKHMGGEYSSVTPTTKKDETSPKKKPFLGFFRGK